jgi:uracil phosphoribosyltransferase
MKDRLLTILRDKESPLPVFREAADNLAIWLAFEIAKLLPQEKTTVETPVGTASGVKPVSDVALVAILRSGLALLFHFLKFFQNAKVGMIGVQRNEDTALPHPYYVNLPEIGKDASVIILEPMIATAGTLLHAVELLMERGVGPQQIKIAGIVAAPQGIQRIRERYPIEIIVAQIDETLNERKYIIPGLGDFGDRYFGTSKAKEA